jgi:DNA-binding transcriptional MerR regulator
VDSNLYTDGMDGMTVSELARRAGTTADTVRYYERIGVLREAARTAGGYRLFGDDDLARLAFVKRAQAFGLRLDEIRELLDVRDRGLCPCGHARTLLRERLDDVERQMAELEVLRDEIRRLVEGDAPAADVQWPCGGGLVNISLRERSPA